MSLPPNGDAPCLDFLNNLSGRLTATAPAYGATTLQATTLAGYVADLAARMTTLENPATDNKVTRAQKNVSKKACVAYARILLRVISAFPNLTAVQREELRMNPVDSTKSPRPAPSTKPRLFLDPDGSVQIRDEAAPDRRARPINADGAVLSMRLDPVGSTLPPPLSPADAHFGALATRDRTTLPIPPGSNGRTLHVMAQWYTERGDLSPLSDVVSITIAA